MPSEIFMVGLGNYGRRPILFLRTKTDVLIYRVSEKCPTFISIFNAFEYK